MQMVLQAFASSGDKSSTLTVQHYLPLCLLITRDRQKIEQLLLRLHLYYITHTQLRQRPNEQVREELKEQFLIHRHMLEPADSGSEFVSM